MSQMSMQEIEASCDGEWVLINEPQTDEELNVLRGDLVFHSKDRDEVHRKMLALQSCNIACFHVGKMPEGTAICL
jgi:hypothetical protein